jgi:hypothetical protein
MQPAPIAFFTFNRVEHARRSLEALARNRLAGSSDLFVFSDGPKPSGGDFKRVRQVRDYVRTISGFRKITLVERQANLGLSKSMISGVTETINAYGKAIVVEDDLVTSPFFLQFMNEGLSFYEGEQKVAGLHGYVYPLATRLPETFFLRGADCWGWATWKRGWDLFESDGERLLGELEKQDLCRQFDFNGSYAYTQMLSEKIQGKNDSWAILWHASCFLKNKLTLYPGRSLVQNIGFDGTGSHCSGDSLFRVELSDRPLRIESIPVEEHRAVVKEIEEFFRRSNPSQPLTEQK